MVPLTKIPVPGAVTHLRRRQTGAGFFCLVTGTGHMPGTRFTVSGPEIALPKCARHPNHLAPVPEAWNAPGTTRGRKFPVPSDFGQCII